MPQDDFVKGIAAAVAVMPGIVVLLDAAGGMRGLSVAARAWLGDQAQDGANLELLAVQVPDILSSQQLRFATAVSRAGRAVHFACRRVGRPADGGPFVLLQEDRRVRGGPDRVQQLAEEEQKEREYRLRQEAERWRSLSMTDPMTGLLNATGFRAEAAQLMRRVSSGTVMYLDLNGFKQVNDRLGHASGDWVLTNLSRRLRASVRLGDLTGRMGGDEFAVFMPDCPADELPVIVERLQAIMRYEFEPEETGFETSLIVASAIGVARYPEEGRSLHDLICLADARMYQDKSRSGCRGEEVAQLQLA
ncbi:GGDEF domain-containing protein [Pseudooceanicola sp. C21-150M6]|uniref:GGDEF domain-containing protein n=1 Tax=Pseudooceanicola sp. C21-150M6 TaxID=3434355 RepID=UPI003D7F800D